MIVTKISEVTKSRVNVELDGEFAFVLYKGELRVYGIKEGNELSQKSYEEIMTGVLPKRAKLRAMNLLKSRAYTTAALKEKLETGGYPGAVVKEALDYVTSFGYLNDLQYALDFIEYNKAQKSRSRIVMDLTRKGVPGELIDRAWEETVGEDRQALEREQIIRWMEKKHFSVDTATYEEKQKMMASLYRKGFSTEMIRKCFALFAD